VARLRKPRRLNPIDAAFALGLLDMRADKAGGARLPARQKRYPTAGDSFCPFL
jgi:hypothetical protein